MESIGEIINDLRTQPLIDERSGETNIIALLNQMKQSNEKSK